MKNWVLPPEMQVGDFKINGHIKDSELLPHALYVQPGSADLCFEIEDFKQDVEAAGIPIELGIVGRNGARGPMRSLYLRDPDGNLIEFCSYRP